MDRHLSPAETAKRFGVSIKALRLYESRGLLNPARTASGSTGAAWRAYGPDQNARLHQILALKRLGLPLARIGEILSGADRLEPVLALQERVLVQDGERVSRALGLVRAARAKLAAGRALSIDDLANLTKETTMTTKLSGQELFHPALQPFAGKYFSPEELDMLAQRVSQDREKSVSEWMALHAELNALAEKGDPTSPEAQDLCRRWQAAAAVVTGGDKDISRRIRSMMIDAKADPVAAAKMPITAEAMEFLVKAQRRMAESG
jgi:DNA-binding transcriptional MerR regulator